MSPAGFVPGACYPPVRKSYAGPAMSRGKGTQQDDGLPSYHLDGCRDA